MNYIIFAMLAIIIVNQYWILYTLSDIIFDIRYIKKNRR